MRQGKVFIQGIYAGMLTEDDDKKYHFQYGDEYLNNSGGPVCRAMPKSQREYESNVLFPYFFNILSEGANRRMQSELLHIDQEDDFGILLATAQYDTPGAVTVLPENV